MCSPDLIWNVPQDMPDPSGAVCPRGQTYYTNDENAENRTIYNGMVLPPDTWDRLDFCNLSKCFFCVCTVDGMEAKCMPRPVWFCDYYRKRRDPNFIRDVYRHLFGQNRPAYFWTLSARMRRSMDDGIFALIDAGTSLALGIVDVTALVSLSTVSLALQVDALCRVKYRVYFYKLQRIALCRNQSLFCFAVPLSRWPHEG